MVTSYARWKSGREIGGGLPACGLNDVDAETPFSFADDIMRLKLGLFGPGVPTPAGAGVGALTGAMGMGCGKTGCWFMRAWLLKG